MMRLLVNIFLVLQAIDVNDDDVVGISPEGWFKGPSAAASSARPSNTTPDQDDDPLAIRESSGASGVPVAKEKPPAPPEKTTPGDDSSLSTPEKDVPEGGGGGVEAQTQAAVKINLMGEGKSSKKADSSLVSINLGSISDPDSIKLELGTVSTAPEKKKPGPKSKAGPKSKVFLDFFYKSSKVSHGQSFD